LFFVCRLLNTHVVNQIGDRIRRKTRQRSPRGHWRRRRRPDRSVSCVVGSSNGSPAAGSAETGAPRSADWWGRCCTAE
jgi:hypothetical protein